MNEKQGESELEQVKKVLNNINMFFDGTKNSASGKVLNEILMNLFMKLVIEEMEGGLKLKLKFILKIGFKKLFNHKEDLQNCLKAPWDSD